MQRMTGRMIETRLDAERSPRHCSAVLPIGWEERQW